MSTDSTSKTEAQKDSGQTPKSRDELRAKVASNKWPFTADNFICLLREWNLSVIALRPVVGYVICY